MAISPEATVMDAEQSSSLWTSETFISLKKEFLEAKTEVAAFDILQRLITIDQASIDENAWLDCKDLILVLLESIPVDIMLLRQQMTLLHAVNNSPAHVVSTLANFYSKKEKATELLKKEAVAVSVAFARRLDDTETFEAISLLLAPLIDQKEVYCEIFHQLTNSNGSEHRFRLYQVFLTAFRYGNFNDSLLPFFDFVISDLTGNDILTQLATMDFLSDLAIVSRNGAELLNKAGVIDKIHAILKIEAASPDGGFLFTSAVKFFGCLAHCYPEVLESIPDFVQIVLNMVHNFDVLDPSQRVLAAETFAHLAFTSEAKSKLEAQEGEAVLSASFRKLCSATRTGPVELRSRVVDSIRTVFENVNDEQFGHWLSWLPDLPAILTVYVTRPFPEIRHSVIRLLSIILSRERGVEVMLSGRENIEQFKEWLTNPHSEFEWETGQLKNDLVRALRDANFKSVDLTIKEKLKHYFEVSKNSLEVATMEL